MCNVLLCIFALYKYLLRERCSFSPSRMHASCKHTSLLVCCLTSCLFLQCLIQWLALIIDWNLSCLMSRQNWLGLVSHSVRWGKWAWLKHIWPDSPKLQSLVAFQINQVSSFFFFRFEWMFLNSMWTILVFSSLCHCTCYPHGWALIPIRHIYTNTHMHSFFFSFFKLITCLELTT